MSPTVKKVTRGPAAVLTHGTMTGAKLRISTSLILHVHTCK